MYNLRHKITSIKNFLIDEMPNFFRNIWFFRKSLIRHRWYDHAGVVSFLKEGVKDISLGIEKNGNEETISKNKKIEKMNKLIQLLENYEMDNYLDTAQNIIGKKLIYDIDYIPVDDNDDFVEFINNVDEETEKINKEISNLAKQIQINEWNEIWEILKGQDYSKFNPKKDFDDQRDGTGLNTWWN